MTFKEVLNKFRTQSFTEKEKGTKFEHLMKRWLLTDPRFNQLTHVWLWEEFPCKKDFGGNDTGIDLVAKTELGDYWAIQCKCYAETATIDKPKVDTFISTSSRTFKNEVTFQTTRFSNRIWISTTDKWNSNAEEAIKNQDPPVTRISLVELNTSPVNWERLLKGIEGVDALAEGKKPFEHQLKAISKASEYFKDHDRGKLIMACGTGKTYTSLLIAQTLLNNHGLVLFMVPSIALLGQSLNAWFADADKPIKAVCICSDSKVSRKMQQADNIQDSIVDLAYPASTDPKIIAQQLVAYRNHDGMVVVFSTYQSIDAVTEAQNKVLELTNGEYGKFDFIVCDEAHRTTGVKLSNSADESNFIKIHSNDNVQGSKRLYMTATPRLYGEGARAKAAQNDYILCSMDDPNLYGEEFYRVPFSYAVNNGLLTDYKVLVLTVNETDIPDNIRADIKEGQHSELNFDDTSKLIGVISGLSKMIKGDGGKTWANDPRMMHRAVAFCSKIGEKSEPGTSKNVAYLLPRISSQYKASLIDKQRAHAVTIAARHVDGSMNSSQRNADLAWLAEESDDPRKCRVICNVRCLSEGVDVPSLDAVLFLAPRNSQVDVVQSVGRVMRNFRKGKADEKKYGYIIIPIVVPQDMSAEAALNDNERFKVVWNTLNALRSHDDRFNAIVQSISLNKNRPDVITVGGVGFGNAHDRQDEQDAKQISDAEIAKQLEIKFGELQNGIYAKLVEKCGDRLYWENWSKQVGVIAQKFIERIARLIETGKYKKKFNNYLKGLQKNLNPSIDRGQAIEMLAQHMITQPIFDALFKEYNFVENNAVSRSMQSMIDLLKEEAFEKDTEVLTNFYQSVRDNVGQIDNLEGKQTIIKNIYEKFFKGAFPKTVEQLGIVYTPVECVDFIINSVDSILKTEFNSALTNENVHILDPFTGTGTFITRLLQSGLIKPEDMERKYLHEIHCNEIVLLAYYIADVNIESVFHEITHRKEYLNYDGICLTDTFQLAEPEHNTLFTEYFRENEEIRDRLRDIPIRVIIGNPPYSAGQKSANDNAQNQDYPVLGQRITDTYAKHSSANLNKALYDSYIKAFRWASDRIPKDEGGIVAFISNGSWLDGNAQDGMRRCLEEEFTSIYVLNLRGNQRTSGELSRKEGGKIFGGGSRTPISITILVKNPAKSGKATIYYHDIGDYLTREQKLKMVRDFRSIASKKLEWQVIEPNDKGDWINQRDGVFDNLIPLFPEKKFDINSHSFFIPYSLGIATNKDNFLYNSSRNRLVEIVSTMIDFFNNQSKLFKENPSHELEYDPTKIVWTDLFQKAAKEGQYFRLDEQKLCESLYRPFFKQNFIYQKELVQRTYQQLKLFPNTSVDNLLICVSGIGVTKPFSCIITSYLPDLETIGKSQCFPMYYYEENKNKVLNLFEQNQQDYICRDGISDWILKEVRSRYGGTKSITKESIFYYVYGLLHSQDYRTRFADDLKKSLPRIPIVDRVEDFIAFERAGRQLADLHLNYDKFDGKTVEFPDYVVVDHPTPPARGSEEEYAFYAVERDVKMQFQKVRDKAGKLFADKSTIIFNPRIHIRNIPAQAYDYIVNGKSAIEWVIERYQITVDSASQIKNDPNDWSREHGNPEYILDVLLSVIDLSVKTVNIINSLPHLSLAGNTANRKAESSSTLVLYDDNDNDKDFSRQRIAYLYDQIADHDIWSLKEIITKEIDKSGYHFDTITQVHTKTKGCSESTSSSISDTKSEGNSSVETTGGIGSDGNTWDILKELGLVQAEDSFVEEIEDDADINFDDGSIDDEEAFELQHSIWDDSSIAFCGGGYESDSSENKPITNPGHFVEDPESGEIKWVEDSESYTSDENESIDTDILELERKYRTAADTGSDSAAVRSQKSILDQYYQDYLLYSSTSNDVSAIINLCREYIGLYQNKVLQILQSKQRISKSILDIIQIIAPAMAQHFSGLPAMAIVAALTVVLKNQLFKS